MFELELHAMENLLMILNRKQVWLVAGGVLAVLGLALVILLPGEGAVHAQADPTPLPQQTERERGEMDGPRPARVEGTATWTLGEQAYHARFPEGLTFAIEAASDAGEIVSARVVWTHAPGSGRQHSVGASLDESGDRWVARWEPGTNQVPPWVLVRYRWELTDAQGNRYVTQERDEVYADPDNADRWGHAESEDVVVHWIDLPDEYGQQTIEAMAAREEFFRQAWGGLLPYRPRVILYGWSAMAEYEEVAGDNVIVGNAIRAGTTRGDWGGTVQIATPGMTPEGMAYGTVLHEVAHLYQEQFTLVVVDWFIEGNAEFFSLARGDRYKDYARQRLQSDAPLSFAGGFSARGTNFRDAYWIGTTVWDYLVETYGLDAHRQLWELVGNNVPRFEAVEMVTGVSIAQFERDWRAWLGVFTPPPTLIPTPTPALDIFSMPTPTYGFPGG